MNRECPCGQPSKDHKCPKTKEPCQCCDDCTMAFCEWAEGNPAMKRMTKKAPANGQGSDRSD